MRARSGFDPSWPVKLWLVVSEQLYCIWLVLSCGWPFLLDLIRTAVVPREKCLPSSISELLDAKTFSRLSGRAVESVEFRDDKQLEQHANSTDRAWFKVRFKEDKGKETFIFAKIQAKNFRVCAMMSIFDVYRNELQAYADLEMPVRIPKVYISKYSASRFCLAMEDLREQGVTFPNIWETVVTKELAKSVLKTLAKVHAHFWNAAPEGCWKDANRPYKPKLMGLVTLYNVRKSLPDLVSDDQAQVFTTALWHWDKLRAYWSRSTPKTMVHGDAHMGNFFIEKDNTIGTFDFQVKAEEHPMRDVTYFLSCSYPSANLAQDEKELIEGYLSELEANGVPSPQIPTFAECWQEYRLHSFYAMYAFIFSGGFDGGELMDSVQTQYGVGRICALMERIDAAGALYDLLDGKLAH